MSSTRVEAFLAERERLNAAEEEIQDRRRATFPPAFRLRGTLMAEITDKGDLRLHDARLHPEEDDILRLIEYLGRWFVAQVDGVEVAKEDGDGE